MNYGALEADWEPSLCSEVAGSTWSNRIWQTSGVKWRRAARVLLRILRRPYWTVCKARCSEASVSATGCLEEQPDGVAKMVVAVDGR